MIKARIISSLEKCFLDADPYSFAPLTRITAFKNERISFQIAVLPCGDDAGMPRKYVDVAAKGRLAGFMTVRSVELIPSLFPCYPDRRDDNYLSFMPGLYPDLLLPPPDGKPSVIGGQLKSLWITLMPDGSITGSAPLELFLTCGDEILFSGTLDIRLIDAELPPQTLINTQWFHGDCLATYYDTEVFSEKWWRIVKNFLSVAVNNGQNMILTPVFTPPLDTAVGGERPTVQLVDVKLRGGEYSFSYTKLDRWIDTALSLGFKYLEISHLFTQWGAAHAPKIIADTPDGKKRIFGWETDASGEEYTRFLRAFLTDFLAHMKARGDDKRCFFHISDEPCGSNLAQYLRSKNAVADLLEGYRIIDALSDIEFYRCGAVRHPVAATDRINAFLDENVKELWAYYCCGQCQNVSNRFFAMPSYRTRCIGFQLFKYDIAGFLQWGYNFYYTWESRGFADPYRDSTGNYFTPSGDCYSVYPARDGTALESLRLAVFYEGLQDLRACSLLASLIGKRETIALIEKHLGEIAFDKCPHSALPLLNAREAVNAAVENAIAALPTK